MAERSMKVRARKKKTDRKTNLVAEEGFWSSPGRHREVAPCSSSIISDDEVVLYDRGCVD